MKNKTSTAAIREAFLAYFAREEHERVDSSSLVPGNDATLLFTNAGMVQFKDVFLGDDKRSYQRATSSQRCVRAGGKHNDLENVGYTARHHTFFEMLGNFSFGDYFKREAIPYAWTFLTEVLAIPADRLWVTIYAEDHEAYDVWHKEIGLAPERIIRIGDNKGARYASDNFWSMGDTGPCGPCTEIFYDHGEEVEGGLPGTPEEDGDRYIEIWNIVFMQFNRTADGEMHDLPRPSVDTGMGLERIAAVMQGVHSNYEIDLFTALLSDVASVVGVKDKGQASLRVIADHIRACAFLVADGVLPSNEGRGYVLRRIIRRAVRHGNKLGAKGLFFGDLVAPLVQQMGDAYPELREQQENIAAALRVEEQQFAETLEQGMRVLEQDLAGISDDVIPGATAFKLYDTYGFPLDLTADIARERNMTVDNEGYEKAMDEQRARAKAASQFKAGAQLRIEPGIETEFLGYTELVSTSRIVALYRGEEAVGDLSAGDSGIAILEKTPFYAESGGQVGDAGTLSVAGEQVAMVNDTQKQGGACLHVVEVASGSLKVGDEVEANVTDSQRRATALNHSATHLLHAALRDVLGPHVTQKGSLVDADRLRFDFSHPEPVQAGQLAEVASMVNAHIRTNTPVKVEVTDMESAQKAGAMALFGEKYGDEVRVLTMGSNNFSVELCGGTHVDRTGDIGLMRIIAETGIAAGVRRIEAVTGATALEAIDEVDAGLERAAGLLKTTPQELPSKLEQFVAQSKALEKQLQQLKQKLASSAGADLASNAVAVGDASVLVAALEGVDAKSLRSTLDQLKQKLNSAVVVLAAPGDEKVALVAGVTDDLTGSIKAGDIIRDVAAAIGGKGGGRPDMAQGGGTDLAALPAALDSCRDTIVNTLGG